jgi:hypothetical protein
VQIKVNGTSFYGKLEGKKLISTKQKGTEPNHFKTGRLPGFFGTVVGLLLVSRSNRASGLAPLPLPLRGLDSDSFCILPSFVNSFFRFVPLEFA